MVGERRRVSSGGALARITPDNRGIKREMVDEERLNAGELRRVIKRAAPTAGNGERAADAGEIERAPRLEAGDDGDAAVQEREIRKQRDIIATAAGGQHRRGEATDEGDLRQHQRILQHGEHDQQRRRRRHQRERHRRVKQRVQLQRRQRGQIQNGERRALNGERIIAALLAQIPAGARQHRSGGGDRAITQRQRNMHPRRGIAQQKGETEEENGNARLQQQILAEEGGERRRLTVAGGGLAQRKLRRGTRARRWLATGDKSKIISRRRHRTRLGRARQRQRLTDWQRRGFLRRGDRSHIRQRPIIGRRFGDGRGFRRRKMLRQLGADRLRRLLQPQRQRNRNARLIGDLRLQLAHLAA